jgi:septal ring factor EnvC (AmiA/AmiB activator)
MEAESGRVSLGKENDANSDVAGWRILVQKCHPFLTIKIAKFFLHQKRLQAQREEEARAKARAEKQAAELAAQRARYCSHFLWKNRCGSDATARDSFPSSFCHSSPAFPLTASLREEELRREEEARIKAEKEREKEERRKRQAHGAAVGEPSVMTVAPSIPLTRSVLPRPVGKKRSGLRRKSSGGWMRRIGAVRKKNVARVRLPSGFSKKKSGGAKKKSDGAKRKNAAVDGMRKTR